MILNYDLRSTDFLIWQGETIKTLDFNSFTLFNQKILHAYKNCKISCIGL